MQNPWKLATLVLGAALVISSARAQTSWKQDALSHLQSAAKILEEKAGGQRTGKPAPGGAPSKADASPATKALQLTRAAIVQVQRAQ